MEYPGGVRLGEPVGDAREQLNRAAPVAALVAAHPVLERAVFHYLGYEVVTARVLADVVDGEDVRVIQRRCELCFAPEARTPVCVELSGHELDRDGALQARVGRAIDDAHAAGAEPALHTVRPQRRPGLEARIFGSPQSVHVGRVVTAGH